VGFSRPARDLRESLRQTDSTESLRQTDCTAESAEDAESFFKKNLCALCVLGGAIF